MHKSGYHDLETRNTAKFTCLSGAILKEGPPSNQTEGFQEILKRSLTNGTSVMSKHVILHYYYSSPLLSCLGCALTDFATLSSSSDSRMESTPLLSSSPSQGLPLTLGLPGTLNMSFTSLGSSRKKGKSAQTQASGRECSPALTSSVVYHQKNARHRQSNAPRRQYLTPITRLTLLLSFRAAVE